MDRVERARTQVNARRAKEAAIEAQEFEKAANLRDTERRLTNKKRELEEQWEAGEADGAERPKIGEEEIADIMSKVYKIRPFGMPSVNMRDLNPTGAHVSFLTCAIR